MTHYTPGDLAENWEFKILRSATGAFKDPAAMQRFLAEEEGIRNELNGWAGYLETCEDSPSHLALMERTIQSRQLFTLRRPIEGAEAVGRACVELSKFLARATEGFYQVDEEGVFEAEGELLVRER